MSLQYMVSEAMCMKRHPSLVQPTSSNLQGILLGSTFLLGSFLFFCLEEEVDLLAEEDGVAVSTITTSRLLDTVGVPSVACLRLVSTLEGFGVERLDRSKTSAGGPQLEVVVGGLGCLLSFGVFDIDYDTLTIVLAEEFF